MSSTCSCGHLDSDHAEFIDNTTGSSTYTPERRHCLYQDPADKTYVCQCLVFRASDYKGQSEFKPNKDGGWVNERTGQVVRISDDVEAEEVEEPKLALPICQYCLNSKYPGICWPVWHDKKAWISKCDGCSLFVSNAAAAYFLSAVLGVPIKGDDRAEAAEAPSLDYYTPIDESLVRSMSQALRIG